MGFGLAVGAADAIGPGEVLAIVYCEVEMVECVVSWAVYDFLEGMTGDHVRVMNKDAPAIDEYEQPEIEEAMERE